MPVAIASPMYKKSIIWFHWVLVLAMCYSEDKVFIGQYDKLCNGYSSGRTPTHAPFLSSKYTPWTWNFLSSQFLHERYCRRALCLLSLFSTGEHHPVSMFLLSPSRCHLHRRMCGLVVVSCVVASSPPSFLGLCWPFLLLALNCCVKHLHIRVLCFILCVTFIILWAVLQNPCLRNQCVQWYSQTNMSVLPNCINLLVISRSLGAHFQRSKRLWKDLIILVSL